jgi:hypothetical protein
MVILPWLSFENLACNIRVYLVKRRAESSISHPAPYITNKKYYISVLCLQYPNYIFLPWRIRFSGLFNSELILKLSISYTVGRTPWTGDRPCCKTATYTGQHKHGKNRRQTSMPRVRFEPTIPVLERAKTFRALCRSGPEYLINENERRRAWVTRTGWMAGLSCHIYEIYYIYWGHGKTSHDWWGLRCSGLPSRYQLVSSCR